MPEISMIPSTPFTWRGALSLGLQRSQLEEAVADGRVVKLMHGVYAPAELELTPLVRAQGAGLVINPHSVICDRTAAWIWGVDCFGYAELDGTPPVETCVLRWQQATEREEIVGVTRDLLPEDWVDVDGVRVTTPLRTAMDLGCSKLWAPRALGAMDALMRAHGLAPDDLRRMLRRYRRRRGVVQLRELVSMTDPLAESQRESWTRYFIVASGLPRPQLQVWVGVEDRRYRLDLAYPRAKVAVEYDGEEFHQLDPERRAQDEERRAALRRAGWVVIVLTKHDLAPDSEHSWLGELSGALRARRVVS